jgi:acetyl esterase/lipase
MPFNTLTVACSTAPTIISTFFSHFCSCTPTPEDNGDTFGLSYEEGVALIRRFLTHASHHTVEELQAFTAMYVPAPAWVRTENVVVPEEYLQRSAEAVVKQLGDEIHKVGGEKWWRWRERELHGEWIWVRDRWWGAGEEKNEEERKKAKTMLYMHGGAYFFGSVDEHRYQLQRHARKLGARVFARGFILVFT